VREDFWGFGVAAAADEGVFGFVEAEVGGAAFLGDGDETRGDEHALVLLGAFCGVTLLAVTREHLFERHRRRFEFLFRFGASRYHQGDNEKSHMTSNESFPDTCGVSRRRVFGKLR